MIEKMPDIDGKDVREINNLAKDVLICLEEGDLTKYKTISSLVIVLCGVLVQTDRDIKNEVIRLIDLFVEEGLEEEENKK